MRDPELLAFAGDGVPTGLLIPYGFRRVLLPPHFRSIVQGIEFRFGCAQRAESHSVAHGKYRSRSPTFPVQKLFSEFKCFQARCSAGL
jgi:hypothetical protein